MQLVYYLPHIIFFIFLDTSIDRKAILVENKKGSVANLAVEI